MGTITDGNALKMDIVPKEHWPRLSSESESFQEDADYSGEQLLNDDHHKSSVTLLKKDHTDRLLRVRAINVVWILTWYMFATFLSLYNKWLFSEDHYNFQFPLFVTGIHMVVHTILAGTSLLAFPKLRPNRRPSTLDYILKVLPCAFATSFDIGLSNLSLKTITLSFYTMCKSSTLAFVLLFAFIFRIETPSLKLILIIVTITGGVVLMVLDETEFVMSGFIEVMCASAFGGLRWSLTEILLRKESMGLANPFASIFFLAPLQALILMTTAAIVEGFGSIFYSVFFVTTAEAFRTVAVILLGGMLAFCMVVAEFFLIKRTSVVTLSVCGIFKEVATIIISSIVFGDQLTIVNIIGLCITLFGIGLYNWIKIRQTPTVIDKELDDAIPLETSLPNLESDGEEEPMLRTPRHIYNMVAESTPALMVDGALTTYRDSHSSPKDDDYDAYELR